MKILSAILTTLILFLTMQPVLTNLNLVAVKEAKVVDNCCTHKQKAQPTKEKQEKDNNCCNNGRCENPFLACANCYFINRDQSPFLFAPVFIQTEKSRLVNDKALSSYTEDFWHPPEAVCL